SPRPPSRSRDTPGARARRAESAPPRKGPRIQLFHTCGFNLSPAYKFAGPGGAALVRPFGVRALAMAAAPLGGPSLLDLLRMMRNAERAGRDLAQNCRAR